jgi:hypothetical protein
VILRRTPKIFPRNGTKKITKKRQCGRRRLQPKTAAQSAYIHTYIHTYVQNTYIIFVIYEFLY